MAPRLLSEDVTVLARLPWNTRNTLTSLARTPGWTLGLVLTVALGTGSNASVSAFVRGLMAPGAPAAEDVISVFARDEHRSGGPLSFDEFSLLAERDDLFERLGAVQETQEEGTLGNRRLLLSTAAVSPAAATLLQLPAGRSVFASQAIWQREFAGAPRDERSIRIRAAELLIEDVAPAQLRGLYRGRDIDLWRPLSDDSFASERPSTLWVLGRLRKGIDVDDAQRRLDQSWTGNPSLQVLPYSGLTPEAAASAIRIGRLMHAGAVAVLLIASVNVAALMLSRASSRAGATAVRVAIGASRAQLRRELLSDSLVLSVAGSLIGAGLAAWTAQILPAFLFDQDAEQLAFSLDSRATAGVVLACAAITVLSGLLPLIAVRDDDPANVLRREASGPSPVTIKLAAVLVAGQIALCTLLLISAALLRAGFESSVRTALGQRFATASLASVEALQLGSRAATIQNGMKYFDSVARAATEITSASALTWTVNVPGNRPLWQAFQYEPPRLPRRPVEFKDADLTAAALKRIHLPPIVGRMFGAVDTPQCPTVILTADAARHVNGGDAVGRTIVTPTGESAEIIGVVSMADATGTDEIPTVYHYPATSAGTVHAGGLRRAYGVPMLPRTSELMLDVNAVSPNYFDVMGFRVIAGTTFAHVATSCRVAVVNREAAEQYFSGDAVDAALIDRLGRRIQIIGVVESVSLGTVQRTIEPTVYLPMRQDFQPRMTLLMAGGQTEQSLLTELRRRIATVPGGRPDRTIVTTLSAHLARTSFAAQRIASVLVGAFATLGIVLGVVGLFSVMNDATKRRDRELALRIALGAKSRHVISQVVGDGVRLVVSGALVGLAGSLGLGWWLLRTGVVPNPPSVNVWLLPPITLAAMTILASLLPARRALASDPLKILKAE